MYAVLLIVLLMLISIALIGYPIWKGRVEKSEQADWSSPMLAAEKDAVMGALSEIEFDYQMKKLSEEDYRSLKSKYAKVALAILDAENTNPKGNRLFGRADAKAKVFVGD